MPVFQRKHEGANLALVRPRTGLASPSMRAMFITYMLVIVSGIAFYTAIGLTHH